MPPDLKKHLVGELFRDGGIADQAPSEAINANVVACEQNPQATASPAAIRVISEASSATLPLQAARQMPCM